MLFADSVAIEVGVGSVALLAVVLAASILGGFVLLGLVLRSPIAGLCVAVADQGKLLHQTNTLLQISMARRGGPPFTEN